MNNAAVARYNCYVVCEMKIEFDYILEDHGWAVGKLRARDFYTEFDASYLYDSLDSVLWGAIGLVTDKQKVTIPFFSEPGEHQIVIEKLDRDKIEIELRWYDDYVSWNMVSQNEYEIIFKGETTLKSFVDSAYQTAKRILDEDGPEGYSEKWRGKFPVDDFEKLERIWKASV